MLLEISTTGLDDGSLLGSNHKREVTSVWNTPLACDIGLYVPVFPIVIHSIVSPIISELMPLISFVQYFQFQ